MMMMYQDDKNECGLGVIVKTTHVKRKKKTVISLLSATSTWSEIGMQARGSFLLVKNNTTKKEDVSHLQIFSKSGFQIVYK